MRTLEGHACVGRVARVSPTSLPHAVATAPFNTTYQRGHFPRAPVDIAVIAAKLPLAAARNPSSTAPTRPRQSWRSSAALHFAFCGFVTAAAAYNELYYAFTTWWGHRLTAVPGFLVGAMVAVAVASACLSAALTCDLVVTRNKG